MDLDVLLRIGRMDRPDAVIDLVARQAAALGYSVFAIGAPSRGDLLGGYFYSTWPQHWIDTYLREGMVRDDPVPLVASVNAMPFRWSDMLADRAGLALTPAQRRCWQIAAEAGWREGVVVPIHGPGAYLVVASFGGAGPDTSPASMAMLQMLAIHAHVRLSVLHAAGPGRRDAGETALSPREVEALSCVLAGLGDAMAARRMGIGERTVRHHLDNARRKLGARTRGQAAAAALALGLLAH